MSLQVQSSHEMSMSKYGDVVYFFNLYVNNNFSLIDLTALYALRYRQIMKMNEQETTFNKTVEHKNWF